MEVLEKKEGDNLLTKSISRFVPVHRQKDRVTGNKRWGIMVDGRGSVQWEVSLLQQGEVRFRLLCSSETFISWTTDLLMSFLMWILLAVKTLQFNSLLHYIFGNICQVPAMLMYRFLGIHWISLFVHLQR